MDYILLMKCCIIWSVNVGSTSKGYKKDNYKPSKCGYGKERDEKS